MAPSKKEVIGRKRFVFQDCTRKPLLYRGIARAAGFSAHLIQGRMVVDIELHDKGDGGKRKRAASKKR